jgi:hypothetical protein
MKNWWQSKTIWASLGLIIIAIIHYYKTNDLTKATELIFTALGLIGIRVGNKKII